MSLPFSHSSLCTWTSNQIFQFRHCTWCDQARSCIHRNAAMDLDERDLSFENGRDSDGRKTRTCIAPKRAASPCLTCEFRNSQLSVDS